MNRQVPEMHNIEPIAIIGNGKMARHMIHYFESVGQPHIQWMRPSQASTVQFPQVKQSRLARFKKLMTKMVAHRPALSLAETVAQASTVLILIADDQIEPFIDANPCLRDKCLVHFSGSLYTDKAMGCHPLMTFGAEFYRKEQYQKIPFVVDEGVDFNGIFPQLNNPVHTIKASDKVKYHAMCVMAGNFSQMMWQAINNELRSMDLSADLMSLYLKQNVQNFVDHPERSATGPFVRGDIKTIAKHQAALEGHPLAEIYQAFYQLYQDPTTSNQGVSNE